MSASSPPLNPGDPGGPGGGYQLTKRNGEYTNRLLPEYLDRDGSAGQLQFLRMRAKSGAIPNDPFLLRLSVEKHIGGQISGAFKENKGISYVLKVRSQAHFDKLLKMKRLADGTEIEIEEHSTLNQVKCIVSNADTIGLEESYLVEQLQNQKVKEVRRIKRRNNTTNALENTPTLILTISGTVIPEHVDFGWSRCRTRHYYPSPMQCYRCWSFGHTGKRCTAPSRVCGRCSKVHPEDQTPEPANDQGAAATPAPRTRSSCSEPVCCKTCNNSTQHALSSRDCPVFKKENAIQIIRVDEGISYPQARREFEAREALKNSEQNRTTYAGVTSTSKDAEIAELRKTVRKLENDAARRESRMADMELALANRQVSGRLEATKEHGPIEELIRQVAELTATVRQLQADLKAKDETIAELREKQMLTPRNSVISIDNSTHSQMPTPQVTSPNTTHSSNTFKLKNIQPEMASQVADWLRNLEGEKNEAKMSGSEKGAIPKKQKKGKGKGTVAPPSDEEKCLTKAHSLLSRQGERGEFFEMNIEDSDNSIDSRVTAASSAVGSKRNHLHDSSAESIGNSSDEVRITRSKAKLLRETVAKPLAD